MGPDSERWIGAIEGYYGRPLGHAARIDLIKWMGTKGLDTFVYAPKDDPYHRRLWRDPYPDEHMAEFAELVSCGRECGVDVGLTISPGLDWNEGDDVPLVDKLRPFVDAGTSVLGILWDDVRPGGAELGATHGGATAAAVDALGDDVKWWTVPTDYAVSEPTEYLRAFAQALPDEVVLAWTGPSVVPLRLTGAEASSLGDALGRKLLLWENFPVNDGPMRGVLHIGPYPDRSPDLVAASAGVLFNLMPQAIANRVGVECGARFWQDPSSDREEVWREVIASFDGLGPLARASRSWVTSPEPEPELVEWANSAPDDPRLREFLQSGCRDGLDPELAKELEPWLDAWDREAQVMFICLDILERGHRSVSRGLFASELWVQARLQREQVFGIRAAGYPVTEHTGERMLTKPEAAVFGENLTDKLCRRALLDA